MKKFLMALALTATVVPSTAFAQAAPPAGAQAARAARTARMFAKLNLTVDQKQQIKTIRQADRQQNEALYSTFRAKTAAYRQLKLANDPAAASAKVELQAVAQRVKAARKATRDQILSVLTPEQRAALQSQIATERARKEAWKSLGLTADQKQQIKSIRQADFQANKELFQSFRATAKQYRQLKRANDPNAATVKTQLEALRGQVKAARTATRDRVLSVLTPEQRAQLEKLRG